ncbi:MAG: MFS transporter [Microbacterium sp.]|nr:MFS transporter [Microbacterium sp.]
MAAFVGTTIEWYDFYVYATAAALVFGPLFFPSDDPLAETAAAFATFAVAFLVRPLGGIVFGHIGDKLGRRVSLVITLLLMGAATVLVGCLPTYENIGILAPILLILLRAIQGLAVGGEWGGAVLMSVEHAPEKSKTFYGGFTQLGNPAGALLASGIFAIMARGGDTFIIDGGWRIPFLLSIVLIAVGYVIRRAVDESPVFEDLRRRRKEASAPLGQLFRSNTKQVVLTAVIFIANNAAGYLLIAFFATYAVTALGMERPPVLLATTLASFGWLIFTLWGGHLSDRLGRIRTFQIGYVALAVWAIPMWFLIDTANIVWYFVALFVMTFALGLSYGPQAALYAEMFPANVRYSGVSIGYALGAILGGAFAPMIAESLLNQFHAAWTIGLYIAIASVISLIGVSLVKETKGVDLSV